MEKPLVCLVVLLLIFALVFPLVVFKATGLTMYEWWAGIKKPKAWITDFTVAAMPNKTEVYAKLYDTQPSNVSTYAYWLTGEIKNNQLRYSIQQPEKMPPDVYFGDMLNVAKTGGPVHEAAGRKWLYIGAWQDSVLVSDEPIYVRMQPAGEAEHVFDIMVPGSLVAREGFSGDYIKTPEDIDYIISKEMGKLKAKILGFLDEFKSGRLTEDEINAGFAVEKLPILANRYTIYGVFRVPIEIEWHARTRWGYSACWVPSMIIHVFVAIPSKLPEEWISSLRLLKGVEPPENLTVLGVYNGWPLTATGTCPFGIQDFEQLLLGPKLTLPTGELVPSPLSKFTTIDGFGVTAPVVKWSKTGAELEYEDIPLKLIEAKLFDIDIWRREINFNPRLSFLTPNKFFSYSFETEKIARDDNNWLVLVRVNIAKGPECFNRDGYQYLKFNVKIPIAWTMDVPFKVDLPSIESSVKTWQQALSKLGFSDLYIANRLKSSLKTMAEKLREWGRIAEAENLESFIQRFNFGDLPKYILSVSESVTKTIKLPTTAELLSKYAGSIFKLDYTPAPAQFPTPEFKQLFIQGGVNPPPDPLPFSIELPKPIGMEVPDIVTYSSEIPTSEKDTVRAEPAPRYERPYTAEMYARDAILTVSVVLGSLAAGLFALRLVRKR